MNKPAICIIGTGLIGGSLALALKRANYCGEIVGTGRTVANLSRAVELEVIDRYDMDYSAAVSCADIVVVSVPLGAMRVVFEQIQSGIDESTIVTDAGSAKQSVIDDANAVFGVDYHHFVPGHPIAGTERSGVEAAFAELYQNRRVILTPTEETSTDAVAAVRAMWEAAGADVEFMNAVHHDQVLAGTSHLPHLLAFGLVDCLNNLEDIDEIFRFAAGGFRDFTRIASSDPLMWRDICIHNREEIMTMMMRYRDEMEKIYRALENKDDEKLKEIFNRAKKVRDAFCG